MIKPSEYAKRRKAVMAQIGQRGIVIIPSAPELIRNGDAVYPYRQQSDFYYLSGFEEPESVLVLAPKRTEGEYILFNRIRNKEREIWDGPRVGQAGAKKLYLADQAFPIEDWEAMLPELLIGRDTVYYPVGINFTFDTFIIDALISVLS